MTHSCRFCGAPLQTIFVDLGMSPLCQTHIEPEELGDPEVFYPLRVYVCDACHLVQLPESVPPEEIFSDYAYFSSYSTSWVDHARRYAEAMIERFGLGTEDKVMEIASNDGYLLQHFVERGVPVLGIEPAENVARVAISRGIPSLTQFFGTETAGEIRRDHGEAQLLLGNNVLAHVPDLNDFVGGMKTLLAPDGVITMEFPHLRRLIEENQFDTIYHEHYSYLSFVVVEAIFSHHGLTLFDVEEIPTHGGSLRIYGRQAEHHGVPVSERLEALRRQEIEEGFASDEAYQGFEERAMRTKRRLLDFLINAREEGKVVAGYGAPGKGNTLLNYCGIRTDLLSFTVDASPHKQGRFTPGTRIPIFDPEKIREVRPDYVLILPWNLKDEIARVASYVRDWGGQFVVPIPELIVF
jgi:SAM-dependent methyltransferase